MPTRRELLRAGGGASLAPLAGCIGVGEEPPKARFAGAEAINRCEREQTVVLSVERAGEPVFSSSYAVPPSEDSATSLEGDWPMAPDEYTVEVGVPGEQPEAITLTEEGCHDLVVEIDAAGVSIFVPARSPERC